MEGLDGIARRLLVMDTLRREPPKTIGGVRVASITDHQKQSTVCVDGGEEHPTGMIACDVLYYTLENGDRVIVRPSGTEPKIKLYFLCQGETEQALAEKIERYKKDAERFTSV